MYCTMTRLCLRRTRWASTVLDACGRKGAKVPLGTKGSAKVPKLPGPACKLPHSTAGSERESDVCRSERQT